MQKQTKSKSARERFRMSKFVVFRICWLHTTVMITRMFPIKPIMPISENKIGTTIDTINSRLSSSVSVWFVAGYWISSIFYHIHLFRFFQYSKFLYIFFSHFLNLSISLLHENWLVALFQVFIFFRLHLLSTFQPSISSFFIIFISIKRRMWQALDVWI